MKTIKENIENLLEIKNSKFISIIIKINDKNINSYLEDIKIKYPKATHYCYAYIYNNDKRSSDDGEPSGTAGMPILNVLEKENLNNVLVVVVRYFGGIKLGAGGLVRAYTKSVTEALKKADYIELMEGHKVLIEFNYNDEKQINYILGDSQVIDKSYNENISYTTLVSKEVLAKLHNYNYKVLDNLYIEKKNS